MPTITGAEMCIRDRGDGVGTCENAVPEKEEDINVFEGSIISAGI